MLLRQSGGRTSRPNQRPLRRDGATRPSLYVYSGARRLFDLPPDGAGTVPLGDWLFGAFWLDSGGIPLRGAAESLHQVRAPKIRVKVSLAEVE